MLEVLAINYINETIKKDEKNNRSERNIFKNEYDDITKSVSAKVKEGFRVFLGAGNVFYLRSYHTIGFGWVVDILHYRCLAQRRIVIPESVFSKGSKKSCVIH